MGSIFHWNNGIKLKIGDVATILAIFYFLMPIAVQTMKFLGIAIVVIMWFAVLKFHLEQISKNIILCLTGWVIVYSLCQLLLHSSFVSLAMNCFSFFLFFFPAMIYYNYSENCFSLKAHIILIIACVAVLIGSINTILVLNIYPNASRILATGSSEAAQYARIGAGGYGFVYGVSFIIPCAVKSLFSKKNKYKIALCLFIIVCFWMLVKAAYTIALIVVFFGSVFAILKKRWQQVFAVIVSIISSFIIKGNVIGDLLVKISDLFASGSMLQLKFVSMSRLFYYNDFVEGTGSRIYLYERSWNAIKESPFFGGLYSGVFGGGHTSWLDLYARFGVFSLILFSLLIYVQRRIYLTIPDDNKPFYFAVLIIFWILGFINPIHSQMMIGMSVFLVVPIWLNVDSQ